ncbi:MAG: LysM peptidoglycan-binding domain-containing protein [Muribaculaceae bacterium]|nr:LysM peptidoglycan-binding domain-containing protein [Muribaculaceae bacterium]
MQSFSFRSNYDDNQNVESLIKERNRKIARQQVVFAILLFIVIGLLVWYLVKKTIYAEFDGYIHTEYQDYRAVEDIYLFEQYTEEGDIVIPGDTLYSYAFINLFGLGSMGNEPQMVVNDRNLRMQRDAAYTDANVYRVRIAELEAQIAREDNNIRFGLSDNSHKMDLQRQLAEARAQLKAALGRAYIYSSASHESHNALGRTAQYSVDFANEQWGLEHTLRQLYRAEAPIIRYAIAQDTAIVTKRWAAPFSRVFKKEHVLQLEALSYEKSNMQVIAWVPAQDMGKINNNTRAEIIVNDALSFMASVQLLGARTEDLPEELRNNLSHTYTTIMVVLRPDRDQALPLWSVVDRVPVRVRVKNYDDGALNDGSDYWYIDNNGLTTASQYFLGLIRKNHKGRYRYRPPIEYDSLELADYNITPFDHANYIDSDKTKDKQNAKPASKPEVKPKAQPKKTTEVKYTIHTIKRGESLTKVAKNHGVTIDQIRELNPEVDQKFNYGMKIKIPTAKAVAQEKDKANDKTAKSDAKPAETKDKAPEKQATPVANSAPKTEPASKAGSEPKIFPKAKPSDRPVAKVPTSEQKPVANPDDYIIHTVIMGESIYRVAVNYGVTVNQIKELNPGIEQKFNYGMKIKVPKSKKAN